jgi:hypothetical protein
MDLSFARRLKAKPKTDTPELSVLLAEISARQGASPTARVQAHIGTKISYRAADPLVDIFAPVGPSTAAIHRFSDEILIPVNPRKLT